MEWVLQSPQIHSTFSNLGYVHAHGYHVNENCNTALESILCGILTEDKYLRSFRRNISFGQNIKKDLIPLLIHAKDDTTIELLIRILVNLTIPAECLLSLDVMTKNNFGRHIVFEINNLLTSAKVAFSDYRTTRTVIDFLRKNISYDHKIKLSAEQCTNISNCLLLLRNILHIPEGPNVQIPNCNGPIRAVQNQIIWNIFSQSIDKSLIELMSLSDAPKWGVIMVQLVALLYKDQHVVNLHKMLNLWLEASLSESSEDNESNTSPPDRGSEDSSPLPTSDPTSDSSDTGGSGKANDESNSVNNSWDSRMINDTSDNGKEIYHHHIGKHSGIEEQNHCMEDDGDEEPIIKSDNDTAASCISTRHSERTDQIQSLSEKKKMILENSDCGYGTQIENQESISTSSNDDELPAKKPAYQKSHNSKQKTNKNKMRSKIPLQERKRKKIVKRGKSNIINVRGLSHKTPTDNDISKVLKEFTVDFLLKGYNSLVKTLHNEILTNMQLEIDTSHFFWLVTYFLKFATQIDLEFKHVSSVLSFDIISYLTYEGVNLCEQFDVTIKQNKEDLAPSIRRLHLVVTAIREFVQALEVYRKLTYMFKEDQEALVKLQMKMCDMEELQLLFILLLRHYNSAYQSKQYLQDLIVTNHILLLFLDSATKSPNYHGSLNMFDHIKQFATSEVMYQYGSLLEDYTVNGEFVNDCIFTMMHHVGGDLSNLRALFQPKILKIFTSIWKSEYEICDDWSDLIEYVINTFIKKPQTIQISALFGQDANYLDDKQIPAGFTCSTQPPTVNTQPPTQESIAVNTKIDNKGIIDKWSEEHLTSLSWNFLQCKASDDVVNDIIKKFNDDGVVKSGVSVINELYKQKLISTQESEAMMKRECGKDNESSQIQNESGDDEIIGLCEQQVKKGNRMFLEWVQKSLLDMCAAKIYLDKKNRDSIISESASGPNDIKLLKFELFKKKTDDDVPVMSSVAYHCLLFNQSVPLVPWKSVQDSIFKDLTFMQLMHKLGFCMPVDSCKIFIRIPNYWTAEFLYEIAGKLIPIDKSKLKFSTHHVENLGKTQTECDEIPWTRVENVTLVNKTLSIFDQVPKQKHLGTMVNFTPMPAPSYNLKNGNSDMENWLDIVQKSQKYKLGFQAIRKETIKDVYDDDVPMLPTINQTEPEKDGPPIGRTCVAGAPTHGFHPPVAVPSEFNMNISEADEYFNSVYETASVASDLIRMYVSDEDDKIEG